MKHRRLLVVAAIAAAVVAPIVPNLPGAGAAATCAPGGPDAPGGEWWHYGQDLANSRSQPAEDVIGPDNAGELELLWSYQASAYNNTPIVADGCVYLADSSGVVTAHNADTGEAVWTADLETEPAAFGGGLVSTPAIHGNLVFVITNVLGAPSLYALDRGTGAVAEGWPIVLDDQERAMSNSSPVVFGDLIFAGFSGDAGPGHNERGGYVIIDIATRQVLAKHYVIDDASFAEGYAGAGVWSTPAIDMEAGYAYVGTSNPHSPQLEHELANSILKIDLDRTRPTFGTIVDHYKGLPDTYVPGLADQPVCDTYPGAYYVDRFSASCVQLDMDFGASPTLFDVNGTRVVGDLQKAGVFHVVDPATMDGLWQQVVGVPCLACNAASPASADGAVFTHAGPPGQLFRLDGASGSPGWVGTTQGVTSYSPPTVANGVVYIVDGAGFLSGYDAESGAPVLKRNLTVDAGAFMGSATTSAGIAVARNTLYVATNNTVFAFRIGAAGGGGGGGGGGEEPPPSSPGGGTPIISGPGAFVTNYATPIARVPQGGSIQYSNFDAASHDVLSTDGLFGTALIGTGQSAPVAGVETLTPGDYEFYCSLHANMRGTITVTA